MVRSRGWLELEPLILTWDFGLLSRELTYPTKTERKIIIFKSQLDMIGCRVRVMFFFVEVVCAEPLRGGVLRIHAITPQKVTWNNMNETQKLVVGRCFKCFFQLHPRNLTWNLKIMVSKWTFLFQGLIFRFHVKLRGCMSIFN